MQSTINTYIKGQLQEELLKVNRMIDKKIRQKKSYGSLQKEHKRIIKALKKA